MPRFSCTHRVTYSDCTVGNHVYYGRYLDLLEAARGEFFRHLRVTFDQWQQRDTIFPVTESKVQYRAQARYDDLLTIEIDVVRAQGVRIVFAYRILNEAQKLVIEAETTHACTDVAGKIKRLPGELEQALSGVPEARNTKTGG